MFKRREIVQFGQLSEALKQSGVTTTKKGEKRRSRKKCKAFISWNKRCPKFVPFGSIDPRFEYCDDCFQAIKHFQHVSREKAKEAS